MRRAALAVTLPCLAAALAALAAWLPGSAAKAQQPQPGGAGGGAAVSRGVAINVGRIEVRQVLYPGRRYDLATVSVVNTGSGEDEYTLSFIFAEGQRELRPDPAWLVLRPERVRIAAGGRAPVRVGLALPLRARPGRYFAFLAAHPVARAGSGVTIGVAAAARLSFEVGAASPAHAAWFWLADRLSRGAPWSYAGVVLAVLAVAVFALGRRYSFQFRIERRGGGRGGGGPTAGAGGGEPPVWPSGGPAEDGGDGG